VQLSGGTLNLGGADLQVAGTLGLGSGAITNARNVSTLSGGAFNAGSGNVTLFGNWSGLGSFAAGSSSVNFIDGGLSSAQLSGSTTFNAASFVSTTGKSYLFPVGLTQTFNSSLTILGTSAAAIQFKSSAPGQIASVNLLPGGTQNIDFVGVSDVHSTGQHLAPTKTNDGGTGNALGWFGALASGAVRPAPMLSIPALCLLALAVAMIATRQARRRTARS